MPCRYSLLASFNHRHLILEVWHEESPCKPAAKWNDQKETEENAETGLHSDGLGCATSALESRIMSVGAR